jgi:septal ring factor EnvC (AmiA/AmiB activator)
MNSKQMQAELNRINRQLGQLRRRLAWNYDQVIEMERRVAELAAAIPAARARDEAQARFVAELFGN